MKQKDFIRGLIIDYCNKVGNRTLKLDNFKNKFIGTFWTRLSF